MKLMNPGYENESVGGSLYWNSKSGNCYSDRNDVVSSCDFSKSGLMVEAKELIGEAVWNTGSPSIDIDWTNDTPSLTLNFYQYERNNEFSKCSSNSYCNDTVIRTTSWKGKIALINVSDYGFSMKEEKCLSAKLFSWTDEMFADCLNNSWLYKSLSQWTLSAMGLPTVGTDIFNIYSTGYVRDYRASTPNIVIPSLFLKSNIKITSGKGTEQEPFSLSLE